MSKPEKKMHEPLIHLVKRDAIPWYQAWAVRIIAVLAALIFSGVITIILTGLNPLEVYQKMFEGAFGTDRRIWNLLTPCISNSTRSTLRSPTSVRSLV